MISPSPSEQPHRMRPKPFHESDISHTLCDLTASSHNSCRTDEKCLNAVPASSKTMRCTSLPLLRGGTQDTKATLQNFEDNYFATSEAVVGASRGHHRSLPDMSRRSVVDAESALSKPCDSEKWIYSEALPSFLAAANATCRGNSRKTEADQRLSPRGCPAPMTAVQSEWRSSYTDFLTQAFPSACSCHGGEPRLAVPSDPKGSSAVVAERTPLNRYFCPPSPQPPQANRVSAGGAVDKWASHAGGEVSTADSVSQPAPSEAASYSTTMSGLRRMLGSRADHAGRRISPLLLRELYGTASVASSHSSAITRVTCTAPECLPHACTPSFACQSTFSDLASHEILALSSPVNSVVSSSSIVSAVAAQTALQLARLPLTCSVPPPARANAASACSSSLSAPFLVPVALAAPGSVLQPGSSDGRASPSCSSLRQGSLYPHTPHLHPSSAWSVTAAVTSNGIQGNKNLTVAPPRSHAASEMLTNGMRSAVPEVRTAAEDSCVDTDTHCSKLGPHEDVISHYGGEEDGVKASSLGIVSGVALTPKPPSHLKRSCDKRSVPIRHVVSAPVFVSVPSLGVKDETGDPLTPTAWLVDSWSDRATAGECSAPREGSVPFSSSLPLATDDGTKSEPTLNYDTWVPPVREDKGVTTPTYPMCTPPLSFRACDAATGTNNECGDESAACIVPPLLVVGGSAISPPPIQSVMTRSSLSARSPSRESGVRFPSTYTTSTRTYHDLSSDNIVFPHTPCDC